MKSRSTESMWILKAAATSFVPSFEFGSFPFLFKRTLNCFMHREKEREWFFSLHWEQVHGKHLVMPISHLILIHNSFILSFILIHRIFTFRCAFLFSKRIIYEPLPFHRMHREEMKLGALWHWIMWKKEKNGKNIALLSFGFAISLNHAIELHFWALVTAGTVHHALKLSSRRLWWLINFLTVSQFCIFSCSSFC